MIHLAGPAYAAALAQLHAATFPEDPWNEAAFATLLAHPGTLAWLDERGGFLVLRTVLDEAEILTLGTTTRRQGIAKALLQTAITHALTHAITKIHLEVAEKNTQAQSLYTTHNFTQSGRRPNYYPNGDTALVLCLELSLGTGK
jgi:ribosomal-protein-alanine N-acetyltransferase